MFRKRKIFGEPFFPCKDVRVWRKLKNLGWFEMFNKRGWCRRYRNGQVSREAWRKGWRFSRFWRAPQVGFFFTVDLVYPGCIRCFCLFLQGHLLFPLAWGLSTLKSAFVTSLALRLSANDCLREKNSWTKYVYFGAEFCFSLSLWYWTLTQNCFRKNMISTVTRLYFRGNRREGCEDMVLFVRNLHEFSLSNALLFLGSCRLSLGIIL